MLPLCCCRGRTGRPPPSIECGRSRTISMHGDFAEIAGRPARFSTWELAWYRRSQLPLRSIGLRRSGLRTTLADDSRRLLLLPVFAEEKAAREDTTSSSLRGYLMAQVTEYRLGAWIDGPNMILNCRVSAFESCKGINRSRKWR